LKRESDSVILKTAERTGGRFPGEEEGILVVSSIIGKRTEQMRFMYRNSETSIMYGGDPMDVAELVDQMARALVDRPEDVVVHELKGQNTSVIELKVAKEDVGKVIGKKGRNAEALRTIVGAAAMKHGKTYVLEILD
jgi:uncharacterized protein